MEARMKKKDLSGLFISGGNQRSEFF